MASNIDSIITLDSVPRFEAATWTPGTEDQVIYAGQYLDGDQTIKGDANLVASNIAKGKNIFGVTGTYDPISNLNGFVFETRLTIYKGATYTFANAPKLIYIEYLYSTSTSINPGIWIIPSSAAYYTNGVGTFKYNYTDLSNTGTITNFGTTVSGTEAKYQLYAPDNTTGAKFTFIFTDSTFTTMKIYGSSSAAYMGIQYLY